MRIYVRQMALTSLLTLAELFYKLNYHQAIEFEIDATKISDFLPELYLNARDHSENVAVYVLSYTFEF